MTSIMNLPAIYAVYYDCGINDFVLFVNNTFHMWYDTKEEAEQAAREHYMNNQGE